MINMKTIIFILFILSTNFLLAIFFYKLLLNTRILVKFIVFSFLFFLAVFFLAEINNQINIILRNYGCYIELGNGSIIGIGIWLVFQTISVILFAIILVKRIYNK